MVELLERRGVLVIEHEFAVEAFVATVDWALAVDLRLVGIRASRFALRRRFSMAHELGHLMMDESGDGDVERLADRFAAAFLLPAEVLREGMREGSLEEILRVRREYGASLQSIALRCVDLGMFDRRWAADVMSSSKTLSEERGASWDASFDIRETRCVAALEQGLISASRFRELVGRWPDRTGSRVA